MATKKKPAAKTKKAAVKKEKSGTKKEKIIALYKQGKDAAEIIKITKFFKNTVEGAINHWRHDQELTNSGKYYNKEGKLVKKPTEKPAVKEKKPGKVKPASKKKVVKKTTQSKKKVVEAKPKPVNSPKIPAGTKVYEAPEEEDEVEEIPVDEWTGKPMF